MRYLRKFDDGDHFVLRHKQPIDFCDEIHISVRMDRPRSVHLTCSRKDLENESNWAWRAADLMLRRLDVDAEVKIAVWKRIPTGAGLGGGYSDAATTLQGLASLLPNQVSEELEDCDDTPGNALVLVWGSLPVEARNLFRMAYELGPGIPPFLAGDSFTEVGPAAKFSPLPRTNLPHCILVLQDLEVSSSWAYEARWAHD